MGVGVSAARQSPIPHTSTRFALLRGPEETAPHELPWCGLLQNTAVVPQGIVEYITVPVLFNPNLRHQAGIFRVGTAMIRMRKSGVRQDHVARVSVEIILLAFHFEIGEPVRDRMCRCLVDLDPIAHPVVAGMGDPLASRHELPLGVLAEGVAHAAVASCQTYSSITNRPQDGVSLLRRDRAHSHDGNDERKALDIGCPTKPVQFSMDFHFKLLSLQNLSKKVGHQTRLMAFPATPNNQCFAIH